MMKRTFFIAILCWIFCQTGCAQGRSTGWKIFYKMHYDSEQSSSKEEDKATTKTVWLSSDLYRYKISLGDDYTYNFIINKHKNEVYSYSIFDTEAQEIPYVNYLKSLRKDKFNQPRQIKIYPDSTRMIAGFKTHKVTYKIHISKKSKALSRVTAWYATGFPDWNIKALMGTDFPGIILKETIVYPKNYANFKETTSTAIEIKKIKLKSSDYTPPKGLPVKEKKNF